MKNLFRTLVVIMASVAIMSCQKEESSTSLSFIENTKWLGEVRITASSLTTYGEATTTVGIEFLEDGVCWYNQQTGLKVNHFQGTYTVSSDNKTVTLTFEAEGGGIITETGIISTDGKTMTYKSADSLLGEFTLTKL